MVDLLAVGAGGFIGAVGRYLLGLAVGRVWRGDFPLGTFLVNMLGSFALGLLVINTEFAGWMLGGNIHAALGVGFLGSFTTYSTLMYESFTLADRGRTRSACLNVLGSMAAGLLLAWLGLGFYQ